MTWEDEGSWFTEIGAACLPVVVGGQTVRNELVGLIITCTKDERETGTALIVLHRDNSYTRKVPVLYIRNVYFAFRAQNRNCICSSHRFSSHPLSTCTKRQKQLLIRDTCWWSSFVDFEWFRIWGQPGAGFEACSVCNSIKPTRIVSFFLHLQNIVIMTFLC